VRVEVDPVSSAGVRNTGTQEANRPTP
jgi:hypothetical protein